MKIINIKSLFQILDNETKSMFNNDQLIILTFKKDRHILLTCHSLNNWIVQTDGYTHETISNLTYKEAMKIIKKYKDIEFARSNKLYLQVKKTK